MVMRYRVVPNDPIGFCMSADGEFVSFNEYEILLETFIDVRDRHRALLSELQAIASGITNDRY